jgi:uncharacterized membrane protein
MRYKAYLIASVPVFAAFTAANYYSYLKMGNGFCDDCSIGFGFPFVLWREGGFAGGGGIFWIGLVANVSIAVCASIFLGWALKKMFRSSPVGGS